MCRQRLAQAGSRQGAALPATGRRSLSAAVLLALLNRGAEFTAPPACSPPRHRTCRIPCLALNVPCRPPVPCALTGLGSWLPARLGLPGRVALAARSPFLAARGPGGGTRGATRGSGISYAEAVSGRFAQRRGEALV